MRATSIQEAIEADSILAWSVSPEEFFHSIRQFRTFPDALMAAIILASIAALTAASTPVRICLRLRLAAAAQNPTTMSPQMTAIDSLRLMWDGGFRHIPVIEGDRLVGVVSRGDFRAGEEDRLEEERQLWEHMR